MQTSQPIVVGVDGSEASLEALREAGRMAGLMGCPLKAVTLWDLPVTASDYPYPLEGTFEDAARERLDQALAAVFGAELPPGLEREVRSGSPARVLRDLSEGARMVVVGSRGHGGFVGLLLGSVSSAVAAHARCPVLITHRPVPEPASAPAG
ncbi:MULTISPECIES: universal stress protein [Citricoccus]|uniref:universal stress protein n=1 Tax=Citricoccus TaxID=169133 RepID=UPI000255DE40|nr:universal stress protein [Citricoccus sp. CH26A]